MIEQRKVREFVFTIVFFVSFQDIMGASIRDRSMIDLGVHLGRELDERAFYYQKDGDCPSLMIVSSFLNGICDKECFLDLNCPEHQKCCQNTCGGTHCQLPISAGNLCETLECSNQGEICEILDGQASCVCNINCTSNVSESVCADDGRTYDNRCWMDAAACEGETDINEIQCPVQSIHEDVAGITMLISPLIYPVEAGNNIRLICDAESNSLVSYAWIVTQQDVQMAVLMPGDELDNVHVSKNGKVLIISSADAEDAGNYGCIASNIFGLATVSHKLVVHEPEYPVASTVLNRDQTTTASSLETREDPSNSDEEILPQHLPDADIEPPARIPSNEVCILQLDQGHCYRQEVRWFYNLQSQRCEPFMYGGCGGNGNRFSTYQECRNTCPNLPIDRCRHPIVSGICKARFTRWAYNEESGECVQFGYGGCGANGNNFRTREECGHTCLDRESAKEGCNCVKPKLKSSYCRSDFVISGRIRQTLPSSVNGALLVIEIEEIFKGSEVLTIRADVHIGNITTVRDLSRLYTACNCLPIPDDGSISIFMGTVSQHGEASVDDNSYVTSLNARRKSKLIDMDSPSIRCPSGGEERQRIVDTLLSDEPQPAKAEDATNVEMRLHQTNLLIPNDMTFFFDSKPKV